MDAPQIRTIDAAWLKENLPKLNKSEIVDLFFSTLPDPARHSLEDQQTAENLNAAGVLLTALRARAIGNRNIGLIAEVHVLLRELEQVAAHLRYKEQMRQQGKPGLWSPGMPMS